jgi:transcriptional regulator with XRE-family HTH domain
MAVQSANPRVNGAAMRRSRQKAGLSVTALAAAIGVGASYVSGIELGRRPTVTPARFNLICEVLDVTREELELTDDETTPTAGQAA